MSDLEQAHLWLTKLLNQKERIEKEAPSDDKNYRLWRLEMHIADAEENVKGNEEWFRRKYNPTIEERVEDLEEQVKQLLGLVNGKARNF